MLASPKVSDLAQFTGRSTNTFNNYAIEALAQATLLFYLASGLESYPTDETLKTLAENGILDMADKIYLSQPYREATASPYQSETIGSYSYSKSLQAVKKGDATGVMWFDLAVNKLKAGGTGIGSGGSIEGMEWEGIGKTSDGKAKIIGAGGTYQGSSGAWEIDTDEVIHHHPIL